MATVQDTKSQVDEFEGVAPPETDSSTEGAKRKGPPTKDLHPALFDEEGNRKVDENGNYLKFKEWPDDADKYKSLTRDLFVDETIWLDKKAEEYEEKAKSLREEAEQIRKFGDPEERKKVKKIMATRDRLAKLLEGLDEDVDIDKKDLLAELLG